jgi:serine/threonine protein kinase
MENIINKINKYKLKFLNFQSIELKGGDFNFSENSNISLTGGTIIGKGNTGCIFNPPLKCKNENIDNSTNLVSKFLKEDKANFEYNQSSFLNKIDPDNQYLIYPIKICDIDLNDNNNLLLLKDCGSIEKGKLLYYKYGGVKYTDLKITNVNKDILDIFESITHLLDGLNLMHANDYVHLDIHKKNIVFNQGKPYFIDFEFGTEVKYFINMKINLLNTIQMYWPLELRLLSKELLFTKDYDKHINTMLHDILNHKRSWTDGMKNRIMKNISYKIFYNNKNTFLLSNPEKFCNEVLDQVKPLFLKPEIIKWKESLNIQSNIILNKNTPEYNLYSDILKKADVYAMGIFLVNIFMYFIGQKEVKSKPGKKPYIILNQKGNMVNTSIINSQFLDDLYTNLTKPFTIFIGKVINFNFKTRLTSGELIVEYKKLLPALKKYISDPEFEKLYKLRR